MEVATVRDDFRRTGVMGSLLGSVAPHLLGWQDRRPRGREDIRASQNAILERLLRHMASTRRGASLGLGRIAGSKGLLVERFRELPVEHYADIAAEIEACARGERDVLFRGSTVALAQTSGTTSEAKTGERYIPQSRRLLTHHARGGAAALSRLSQVAGPALFGGRMLMLGGSTKLERNHAGIPAGDLSGITVSRIPWFLASLYEPGRELAL